MPVYASARYYNAQRRDAYKGAALVSCLLVLLVVFFAMALSSGPIILGTEMNANGSVEYLCLGASCEDMNAMRWSDK